MSWRGWGHGRAWQGYHSYGWGQWSGNSGKEQKKAEREQAIAAAVAAIQAESVQATRLQPPSPPPPATYAQVAAQPVQQCTQVGSASAPTPFDASPQGIEQRKQEALRLTRLLRARDSLDKGDPERQTIEARKTKLRAVSKGHLGPGSRLDSAVRGAAEARIRVRTAEQQQQLQQQHLTKVQGELEKAEQELVDARAALVSQGASSGCAVSSTPSPVGTGMEAVKQVLDSMAGLPQDQLPPQIRDALNAMWTITTACLPQAASQQHLPQQSSDTIPAQAGQPEVVDLEVDLEGDQQQQIDDAALADSLQAQLDAIAEDEADALTDAQLQNELQRMTPGFRQALRRRLRHKAPCSGAQSATSEPMITAEVAASH